VSALSAVAWPASALRVAVAGQHWYDVRWARAIFYLVLTLVLARLVDRLLSRYGGGLTKVLRRDLTVAETTRLRMIRRLCVIVILFVGIAISLMVFPQVSTLAQSMLASAGITALVVGFAARSVLANVVSGVIIAFSQPVRLGDYVAIDDIHGEVEEIGLTYTYIRALDDRRLVIPNDLFASKVINNYSIVDTVSAVEVEIVVPIATDLDRVRQLALETMAAAAPPLEGRANTAEVIGCALDSVTVQLRVWIADPRQRAAVARAVRLDMLARLKAAGVIGAPAAGAGEAAPPAGGAA
jgi:small-conductance mechanosensitive channel